MKLHKVNDWDANQNRMMSINLKNLKLIFNSLSMDVNSDPNPDPDKITLMNKIDKLIEGNAMGEVWN